MTVRAYIRWSAVFAVVVAMAYLALLATVTERRSGDFVEGVLLVALIGGAVMAAIRFALGRSERQPVVTDPFSRDVFSTDTINIAHVRVAGVGGAGLVLAALIVALQYELTTVAMSAGIIGGVIMAVARIVSRRRKLA